MTINRDELDKDGLPTITFDAKWTPNAYAQKKRMKQLRIGITMTHCYEPTMVNREPKADISFILPRLKFPKNIELG